MHKTTIVFALTLALLASQAYSQVSTQSGVFQKTYWQTGHIFEKDNSNPRTDEYIISFTDPFDVAPDVVVGFSGVDLQYNNAGVELTATKVTEKEFTLQVVAPKGSLVYFIEVTWLATNSDTIKFKHQEISPDSEEITNTIELKTDFEFPNAMLFISGFQFGADSDVNVFAFATDVNKNGFDVHLKSRNLQRVKVSALVFDSHGHRHLKTASTPDEESALLSGSGKRSEVVNIKLGSQGHTAFAALNHMSFKNGKNFRLNSDVEEGEHLTKVKFTVWADTGLKSANLNIFFDDGGSQAEGKDESESPFQKVVHPQIQTGRFSKTFWNTGHDFENPTKKDAVRSYTFVGKFREPFESTPVMEVGLYGLDLAYDNAGIFLEVKEVTATGFKVEALATKNSLVYFVAIDFVAFVKNAPYSIDSISHQQFDESQLVVWQSGSGIRLNNVSLVTPSFKNPGAISFISGVQFGAGANVRFTTEVQTITGTQTTVTIGTWANTKLKKFRVGVLYFEETETTGSFLVSSQETGRMFEGDGKRSDLQIHDNIPVKKAQFFAALSHIDFINDHNYRLTQKQTHKKNALRTRYTTWGDTQIWKVQDSVMYTPIYPEGFDE